MGDFLMPSLGADMEAGTILEWRVQPGDVVHRGDIVAVVDTEKSDIEVEVFEDGVVEELLVDVGEEVAGRHSPGAHRRAGAGTRASAQAASRRERPTAGAGLASSPTHRPRRPAIAARIGPVADGSGVAAGAASR